MTEAVTAKFYESDRYRLLYVGDDIRQKGKRKWEQPTKNNNDTYEMFSRIGRKVTLTPSTVILEVGAGSGHNLIRLQNNQLV